VGGQSTLGARRVGGTGKKLTQLELDVRTFLDDQRQYLETKQAGRAGSDDEYAMAISLTPPATPVYLQLWLQCHTHNVLLVSGGLLEQPHLLWLFVQTAGAAYENALRLQAEMARAAGATGES
jgi:hypothetical protein